MAQTVPDTCDPQKYFYNTIEIHACGSNLFGQIELMNEEECNIKYSKPIKIADTFKQSKNKIETQISSATETSRPNVCITWDRIICQCGSVAEVRGNGRKNFNRSSLQKAVANGTVTCLINDTGTHYF